jgi:hypothetical protein
VLLVAVLALLLVGYVFGMPDGDDEREVASAQGADASTRCSSKETSELLKWELFRRATALRGRDEAAMTQAARYSVVRIAPAGPAETSEGSGSVTCSANLDLDLPPNVAVVGGRRTLSAPARYEVQAGDGGQGLLRLLTSADAIVTPLAALTSVQDTGPQTLPEPEPDANAVGTQPDDMAAPPPPPPPVRAPAVAPARTQEKASRPEPAPGRAQAARAAREEAARRQREREAERKEAAARAERREAAAREVAAAERPRRPAPEIRATPAPPPRQAYTVRPSFECRRARARSEIAVCSDAGLASLDRQMSAQFFGALRSARPGQRALLQRSRNRFLTYRNRCSSNSCIAQSYRDRMREIDAIMTGGF